MNILYQFNEKYVPYAGTSIMSVIENNKDIDIVIYIAGEDLSEESVSRLKELEDDRTSIVMIDTERLIETIKQSGIPAYRDSYSANIRMFPSYFLGEDVDRILYLDADTIVDGSLREFYNIDFQGNVLAMSLDSIGNSLKTHTVRFNKDDYYFNSGVILFDLNAWKLGDYTAKIIENAKSGNIDMSSPDQNLINVTCKDKILRVSARYNYQSTHGAFSNKSFYKVYDVDGYYSIEEMNSAKKSPVIYHAYRFIGEFPWHKGNSHPFNDLFDRYLRMSPWKNYIKTRAERSISIWIEKILYKILPETLFLRIFKLFHTMYMNKSPESK